MAVTNALELTQENLQEIARGYFSELLIQGNDSIFWIEEMWGNDPSDREEAIEGVADRHQNLTQLHKQGSAAPLMAAAVAKKLADNGIESITPGSDSYGILCDYFVRAQLESGRILQAKLQKDHPATLPRDPLYTGMMDDTLPPLPAFGLGAPVQEQVLGDLVAKYRAAKEHTWAPKSVLDFKRVLLWLVEHLGMQRPVKSVTTVDIGSFRDLLLQVPKNYNKFKELSGLSLKEAIKAKKIDERIAPQTAEKYLNMAKSFFFWCESEGYIEKVPGLKIIVEYKVTEKPRLPFSNKQLEALFKSPIWSGCYSHARRSRSGTLVLHNAYFWIPLVAAYTGMRCGEIIQLRHADIMTSEGVAYFSVNDDEDKSIKTKYSTRRIPIHPRLKEWGFMEFLAERATAKSAERVFHEIKMTSAKDPSNAYSKAFARYLKDIELKNKKLTFHSFRHSFTDALDNASVIDTHKKMMMGHSDGSASAQYGIGASVPKLLEEISKISYDFEKSFDPAPASCKIIKGAAAWA